MPKIAFSDLAVKSLKPGLYFDTKTRGFGIRVGKNRRTWLVLKGERSAKVRLGVYPALSLADARKRALVALGTPYQPSIAPSFTDAREQYLNHGTWRPRFRYQLARYLRLYFKWTKPLDQIAANDVMRVVEAIKKPSEADHAFQSIRALFAWCVPRYLKHSPCFGLKAPSKSPPRSRVLSDDELCKIWTALPRLPASYATIVKLLILTGQRRGEIAALQSSWIHGNKITLPKEITKNKRAHSFPISTLGQSLLKEISTFTDWSRAKITLDNASGVKNWTLHDLRRTFASNLAALGVRLEVIEKLLNHQSGSFAGVVGIYQRYDFFPEMVAAVQLWEDRLKSIVR